jgi:hypothetical protein
MATITKLGVGDKANRLGSTPYGNLAVFRYTLTTNAAGAVINGDSSAAIGIGDVVNIDIIPAGFRIVDSQVIIKTAMTAAVTAKVGFIYADGVDVPAAPQDAAYLGAALVMSAAARLRNATVKSGLALRKDAWLTMTIAGAANAKVSEIEFLVFAIKD